MIIGDNCNDEDGDDNHDYHDDKHDEGSENESEGVARLVLLVVTADNRELIDCRPIDSSNNRGYQ